MYISIVTDELKLDVTEALPVIKSWGINHVDLRSMILGKEIEVLNKDELCQLKKLLDDHGMSVGCLQTSLCKTHMADEEYRKKDLEKLDGIVRAADVLDCRLIRSFHYWQNFVDESCNDGDLAKRGDLFHQVMDMIRPVTDRAEAEGLVLAFENCDVLPEDVFAVLDELSVPGWGLAWDVNNNWYCDEKKRLKDEDAYINKMAGRANCVHVKAGGALSWLKRALIPYDKILKICHEVGLKGPVSAETHNPDKSVSSEEVSRQVIEVIRKAWPEGK